MHQDNSFEVRWSLSELEDIVYDFINAHELPPEFLAAAQPPIQDASKGKAKDGTSARQKSGRGVKFDIAAKQDVCREELMKVAKVDKDKDDNLPQMVREYILHDRGNSLFLGESFGNLPSPVHEDPTIKKLFKFNDDEPDKRKKNESRNQAIRIEGKKEKDEPKPKKYSPEKAPSRDLKVDFNEIERIVFSETPKQKKQD